VFNLGFGEIAVVLVVALIFLGPKMLPEIATGLGKVIREIRKATSDIRQDIEIDDLIRKPLQELRDAATLPPEELKRRDAAKAALRKAEEEAAARKQREAAEAAKAAQASEEALRKERQAEDELKQAEAAAAAQLPVPTEAVSAGGTMIASPPPSEDLQTLTPLPDLHSPAPVVTALPPPRLPPPLPPPARPTGRITKPVPVVPDATVVDLSAQLKAATEMQSTTVAGRPAPTPASKPNLTSPRSAEDKKG
jgi:sec-independent protein translocase protein TatB